MKKILFSLALGAVCAMAGYAADYYVAGNNINGRSMWGGDIETKFVPTTTPNVYDWTGTVIGDGFYFDGLNKGYSNGSEIVLGEPYALDNYDRINISGTTEVENPIIILDVSDEENPVITLRVQTPEDLNTHTLELTSTPGALLSQIDALGDVSWVKTLVLHGELNRRDIVVLVDFVNLEVLDMSDVTVNDPTSEDNYIGGFKDRRTLRKVILPPTITALEDDAFTNCFNLEYINLENIRKGGYYAFYECSKLKSVDLSSMETIPSRMFYIARNLEEVKFSKELKRIEERAFSNTNLKSADIPKDCYISTCAFEESGITEFTLWDNRNIYYESLNGMKELTDLYCYDPFPYKQSDYVISLHPQSRLTIHVPVFSLQDYMNSQAYRNFRNIVALEENISDFEIYRELSLENTEGLADTLNISILGGHITYEKDWSAIFNPTYFEIQNADKPLHLKNLTIYNGMGINDDYNVSYDMRHQSSFVIHEGTVTADNVKVSKLMDYDDWSSRWNFISFPFTVNVNEIGVPESALWVIREYDGAERAANPYSGESKWKNVTSDKLEAGKGYILSFVPQLNFEGNRMFDFTAVNDEHLNTMFSTENVERKLEYHASEYAHNASWNLVGNPFPSYFDAAYVEYGVKNPDGTVNRVPLTRWVDNNYEAFSVDDDCVLQPFESFFVQGVDADNLTMVFNPEGRTVNNAPVAGGRRGKAARTQGMATRDIINLYLTDGTNTDRTRLVINEAASVDYEIICDAAKFMNEDKSVAQIYMQESDLQLSINERPMGSGMFNVGTYFGNNGLYTISADMDSAEGLEAVLIDTVTGDETVLNNDNYTFNATVGNADRFRLSVRKADMNGLADNVAAPTMTYALNGNVLNVEAQGVISVYAIDGVMIATANDTLSVELGTGVYVVSTAGKTVKVAVK